MYPIFPSKDSSMNAARNRLSRPFEIQMTKGKYGRLAMPFQVTRYQASPCKQKVLPPLTPLYSNVKSTFYLARIVWLRDDALNFDYHWKSENKDR